MRRVWKKVADRPERFLVGFLPAAAATPANHRNGSFTGVVLFEALADHSDSKLTYVNRIDIGQRLEGQSRLQAQAALAVAMRHSACAAVIQQHFLQSVGAEAIGARHATQLAAALLSRHARRRTTKEQAIKAQVRRYMDDYVAFEELAVDCPWFKQMLASILCNKLRLARKVQLPFL